MPTGTVKFFNDSKGYGFIQQEGGGDDAFVHISAVERAGMRTLRENQRLSYDLEEGTRGKSSAVNLLSIEQGEPGPPPVGQDSAAQPPESSEQDNRAE